MRVTNLMWFVRLVSILVIASAMFVVIFNWMALQEALSRRKGPGAAPLKQSPVNTFRRADNAVHRSASSQLKLKNWNDYKAIEREARREGVGEYGRAARITNKKKLQLAREMSKANGFNALLSDVISVNRSVPDVRLPECRTKKYLADLPAVSIIMPFFNEHFSALVRSVHSLVNRTPPELIKEILLVDDCSSRPELLERLDKYVAQHFPQVEIMRLRKRKGLIGARLAGALKASGSVLVFLDSHIEANYNWLPPLLEPIVLNKRTAVCPMIDVIDEVTFKYAVQDEGGRGAFDWKFDYKRLDLLPHDLEHPTEPFQNPVMAGGLFAISREFFWELGGYDDGLEVWGGEQYELSFKIWMCGGQLLDAPCSHVGHIFRGEGWVGTVTQRTDDYLHKNYKRVAEVWMDEYKEYLYDHAGSLYDKIDEGDLTTQKALRSKLHCRSFKWFMENVAFDLVKNYPPMDQTDYAYGQVRSLGARSLCLDTKGMPDYQPVGLKPCEQERIFPSRNQDWALSKYRDLRMRGEDYCLQVAKMQPNAVVLLFDCHKEGGSQLWYYERDTRWLVYGNKGRKCLEAKPGAHRVVVNNCSPKNKFMRWSFVHVNHTALDQFPDDSYE